MPGTAMRIALCVFILGSTASRAGQVSLSQVSPHSSRNIALMSFGGRAEASSFTAGYEPEKAFDDVSWHFQAWYPDWWNSGTPDNIAPWIERVLDKPHLIGRIVTRTVLSPQRCSFKLELSADGLLWTKVASFIDVCNEVVATFPPAFARHVRTTFLNTTNNTSPVVYEQMVYEAVTSGEWGRATGVKRFQHNGQSVLLWPRDTVAICGQPLEILAGVEKHGLAGPLRTMEIRCPGAKTSARYLADGVRFLVTAGVPGKRNVSLVIREGKRRKTVADTAVEFLPANNACEPAPFYPLGVFYTTYPFPERKADWENAMQRDYPLIKALGANCVMVAPFSPNPREGPLEACIAILDAAQRQGLKVLLPVWDFLALTSRCHDITLDEAYPQVRAAVAELSGHPALLGYYLFDEPMPWYSRNLNVLERLLRSLDPAHPAVAIFNAPSQMLTSVRAADMRVVMTDPYSVRKDQPVGDIAYRDCYAPHDKVPFGELTESLRGLAPKSRFWLVPQCFGEGDLRLPEPAELRQMYWLAISRGFTGFVSFVFATNPPEGGQVGLLGADNKPTPAYYGVKALFSELRPILPLLAKLDGVGKPAACSPNAEAREFRCSDGDYIVVVNSSVTQRATAVVGLPRGTERVYDARAKRLAVPDKDQVRVSLEPGDGTILVVGGHR